MILYSSTCPVREDKALSSDVVVGGMSPLEVKSSIENLRVHFGIPENALQSTAWALHSDVVTVTWNWTVYTFKGEICQ